MSSKKSSGALGTSRIQSNLLQQNCFVRDCSNKSDIKGEPMTSFDSLDEVTTDKGVELVTTKNSYHITPQYIDSFIDSADYRRDPISAINNGVKRQNLGDISAIQAVAKMDLNSQRSLFEQLSAKFGNKHTVEVKEPVPVVDNSSVGGDNNE